ncbi:hypothetical protein DFP72DRAFT_1179575 [Ephemerocybe angulata]|uniref:Uncharacterized protein n=1 Tax=Ephemerocybe angulata TaxID=980116 RepID=A0A8H6H906_9AGAR|nr:hypothetical protein DFP72DRAFT_1179575 [Tulosesus angulatus]
MTPHQPHASPSTALSLQTSVPEGKVKCDCGCDKMVSERTRRRHHRVEERPLYLTVCSAFAEKLKRPRKLAARAWEAAKRTVSPLSTPFLHQEPHFRSVSPIPVDSPNVHDAPGFPGSPMLLGSPDISQELEAARARQAATRKKAQDVLGVWVQDEVETRAQKAQNKVLVEDIEDEEGQGSWVDAQDVEEEYSVQVDDEEEGDMGFEETAGEGDEGIIRESTEEFEELLSQFLDLPDADEVDLLRVWNWKTKHNITDSAFDDLR